MRLHSRYRRCRYRGYVSCPLPAGFAAQLRLLEEYPEYKYIQSQPAGYEMCRKYYPELFERIKQAVKDGQWIAEGAMWVEPDTNMASGEALIRQLLYGKRYYQEEFGVDSKMLWLPDTFGYTAAPPQILKSCGPVLPSGSLPGQPHASHIPDSLLPGRRRPRRHRYLWLYRCTASDFEELRR